MPGGSSKRADRKEYKCRDFFLAFTLTVTFIPQRAFVQPELSVHRAGFKRVFRKEQKSAAGVSASSSFVILHRNATNSWLQDRSGNRVRLWTLIVKQSFYHKSQSRVSTLHQVILTLVLHLCKHTAGIITSEFIMGLQLLLYVLQVSTAPSYYKYLAVLIKNKKDVKAMCYL